MELTDIKKIIKQGQPQWVKEAIDQHKRLEVHINGKHTAEYLKIIDGLENPNQAHLRKKFLTTNRYMFSNLSRPIDKVFSAKGGNNIYNITNKEREKKLKGKLSSIRHGKPIRKWIQDIQANKYYTDPAGLVFFEWDNQDTYPTIKSIKSITNYRSDGRTLEWVLFEPKQREGTQGFYYRFVDAEFDYMFHVNGELITLVEDETYTNPFGKVPAIINSDLINTDLTFNESPFEEVISLADHYLRTGTIKNINEFLHGFPVFWRYLTDCPRCQGTGQIEGEDCTYCAGKGINLHKDVTDIINLAIPDSSDQPTLTPNVAGYVTPEITAWQEMRTEQDWLFSLIQLTTWGSRMVRDANNETATAAFINVQPVNDRLNRFADAFQDMERKMTDMVGVFYFTNYEGSSITYGRRFLVESADKVWETYQAARAAGSPKTALDYLLLQFYHSEYQNDIERLTIAVKSMRLEPFIHSTDEDIKALELDPEDQKAKYYFNEWYKQLTEEELLLKTVDELHKMFNGYLKTKTYGTNSNVQGN